jgi:hypothetical protein
MGIGIAASPRLAPKMLQPNYIAAWMILFGIPCSFLFWLSVRQRRFAGHERACEQVETIEAQDPAKKDAPEELPKDEGIREEPLHGGTSSSFSSVIMDNIVFFLTNRGYETESFDTYIVAWHKQGFHRLIIKIENSENRGEYQEFETMVLPYYKFRQLIPRLDQAIARLAADSELPDTSQLNTDVITSFGWHAYVDAETRHQALEFASAVWGSSHILNLLGWLRNTWPNNPKLSHYADVAEADYCWFERECYTAGYRRRKALIEKIRLELDIQRMPPSFQRTFRNADAHDYCFIVTP